MLDLSFLNCEMMSAQQSVMILFFLVLTTLWVASAAITTSHQGMGPVVFKLGSQEPPRRLGVAWRPEHRMGPWVSSLLWSDQPQEGS